MHMNTQINLNVFVYMLFSFSVFMSLNCLNVDFIASVILHC